MPPVIVYLTGFRQHAGKTVTSLGIISQLRKVLDPSQIGYLKPVGQEMVHLPGEITVDKDVQLIKQFSQIPDLDLSKLSPVRFTPGFTREYLDSPDQRRLTRELEDAVLESVQSLADKRVIIAEGSGHPGVGSIVGLSNADVGNLLEADIVFLSEAGIGRALDMLEVDLSYFLYKRCRVRGIIFNKVLADKIEMVRTYVTEDLLNMKYGAFGGRLSILGFIPHVPNLSHPSMEEIVVSLPGMTVIGDRSESGWRLPCDAIRVISLSIEALRMGHHIKRGDLIVIGASSGPRIRMLVEYHTELVAADGAGLGGMVLSCGETEDLDPEVRTQIEGSGLPTVLAQADSASVEGRLFAVYENTKLQSFDTRKVQEIEQLFDEYFDRERFLDIFGISG